MNTSSRPPRGRSRFVSNTVALVVQTLVATLITLAQVKILSNFLSKETFGLFASLRGFSLLLAMIAAGGLPQLLVRFIPFHESRGEKARAARLSLLSLLASLLLLALLGVLAHALRSWILAYLAPGIVTGPLILWFALTTASVMLKQMIYGGLGGLRRMTAQVAVELVSLAAVLVWIVAVRHDLTLVLLFKILGVVNGISVLLATTLYFIMLERASGGAAATGETPRYGSYLLWATGISVVAIAFTDADRYLLAQVLSLELLALFHIGARIARLGHRLLGVANLAFQPEITRISAEGRQGEIEAATRIFMKFNIAAAMIVACGVMLFAGEVIVVVASREYLAAVPLMMILAMSVPVTTLTAPLTTVMKALDQVRGALFVDIVWAVFYVGLILVLAPGLGLVGVGAANFGATLAQLVVAAAVSRFAVGGGFIGRIVVKVVLASVVCWWPVYLIGAWLGPSIAVSAMKLLLFAVGTAFYLRMLRVLALFDHAERATLQGIMRSRGLQSFGWFL